MNKIRTNSRHLKGILANANNIYFNKKLSNVESLQFAFCHFYGLAPNILYNLGKGEYRLTTTTGSYSFNSINIDK